MEKISFDILALFIGSPQLSPASNPIILYILDAKIKRSINELLGLHRFSSFNAKKSSGSSSKKKDIQMEVIPQQSFIVLNNAPANSLVKTVLIPEKKVCHTEISISSKK